MVLDEESKAVTEVAKTGGKVVDAFREAVPFVAGIIKGPLKQAMGILEDKLRFIRAERLLRYQDKCTEIMAQRSITTENSKPVPMNFAIPVLENASIEDRDEMQDMWAKLLVNAMDPNVKFDVKRAFLSVLRDIDPLEARILNGLYKKRGIATSHGVHTRNIPNVFDSAPFFFEDIENSLPSEDVQIALQNLVRLRCLSPFTQKKGGDSIAQVYLTSFGEAFVRACSTPGDENEAESQP